MFQSTAEFINKAKTVWGEAYDYSRVEYRGPLRAVTIICPEHGPFEQMPYNHLAGHRCYWCASVGRRLTTAEFVERARRIFPLYDYSRVDYVRTDKPVTIVCPSHGPFERRPMNLLGNRRGCPVCCKTPRKKRGPEYRGFKPWQVELVREVLRERLGARGQELGVG